MRVAKPELELFGPNVANLEGLINFDHIGVDFEYLGVSSTARHEDFNEISLRVSHKIFINRQCSQGQSYFCLFPHLNI